jgi:hypothetical protein
MLNTSFCSKLCFIEVQSGLFLIEPVLPQQETGLPRGNVRCLVHFSHSTIIIIIRQESDAFTELKETCAKL